MTKNILSKISDIIRYLEESGFAEASNKMQAAMDALDGQLNDNLIDPFSSSNDEQMGRGTVSHTYGPAGPGLFSMEVGQVVAKKIVELANGLDAKGCYDEANELDNILADVNDMIDVIKKLDKTRKRKRKKEKHKQNEEVAVRSNGKKIDEVSNSFSGLSDAYFYSGYGNLEGAYGPTDR